MKKLLISGPGVNRVILRSILVWQQRFPKYICLEDGFTENCLQRTVLRGEKERSQIYTGREDLQSEVYHHKV